MTKVLAHVRSRAACAAVAEELQLGPRLLSHARSIGADEAESLSANTKVQAAVVEAALGALFLERGLEAIAPAIVEAFAAQIEFALTESFDAKTDLMELLGKEGKVATYRVLEADGPAHSRTFICAALIDGEQVGTGTGKRKKDAEQAAAREALLHLGAS
jgi:ribonuclease-3